MPDMPARHTGTLDTDLGAIPYHALLLEREDISYTAAYADPPKDPPTGASQDRLLDAVRDQAVALVFGELDREAEIIQDGLCGRELWITFSGGQSVMLARVFVVQDRIYLLMVIAPAEKASSDGVQRFLDSFRLLHG
jgi:hypothetical protein